MLPADETLERRRGRRLARTGWFRDPLRSTATTPVSTPGLRRLCVALVVPVPWDTRPGPARS